jgi:hypothetical protein
MYKEKTGTVVGFAGSEPISASELLSLPCDILIPAALENSIRSDNAASVRAKIIGEAANGPLTPEADRILTAKGAFIIPDILYNAGWVTVSYFEWVQDEQHLFWDRRTFTTAWRRSCRPPSWRFSRSTPDVTSPCGWRRTCSVSGAWRRPPNCAAFTRDAALTAADPRSRPRPPTRCQPLPAG